MGLILVRYGEIALKGRNRDYFIKRLRRNIKDCLKKKGILGEVRSIGQRIYVETEEVEQALEELRNVFGIVSLSPAIEVARDIEAIKDEALRVAREAGLNEEMSFRMDSRRADKTFPYKSPEINRIVGGYVQEATGARVDLSDEADLTIGVEVRRDHVLVFGKKIPGQGGMPLTTEGRAIALISGGIDSAVAAYLIMKRGCGIIPLHFRQSDEGVERFMEICDVLSRYSHGWEIKPIVLDHEEVFGETYEKLQMIWAERWICIFCKRTMLKKACEIAEQHKAKAIVTGDSLGQVASQTVDNLEVISYGVEKPVFRPLIGMDKVEIASLARRIGTYDISAREARACPYLPFNPITKASLPKLFEIMEKLKIPTEGNEAKTKETEVEE